MCGLRFIQPPASIGDRNPIQLVDDPFGDFTSGEVRGMNEDHRRDQQEWDRGR